MLKVAIASLFLLSGVAQAACTAEQTPPAGKPNNFNINKHLSWFEERGKIASRFAAGGLITRSAVMASMFAPHREYDLKRNPNYMSSQEFGNWFYGAVAAQMGFSKTEALTAAAVVQQWQNFNRTDHPDAGDIIMLTLKIYHAVKTGEGDNLDDAAPISGGHSYSTDVYDEDRNSKSNSNSCDQNDSSDGYLY